MRKSFLQVLVASWVVGALGVLLYIGVAAQSSTVLTQSDIRCPGLPSNPVQIFPSRTYRTGYLITNSGNECGSIRLGFGNAASVQLSSTTAILLSTGAYLSDSLPSVSVSSIYCQSVTASSVTISAIEYGR